MDDTGSAYQNIPTAPLPDPSGTYSGQVVARVDSTTQALDADKALRQARQDFLLTAHRRFKTAATAEAEWRREALEDLRIASGDQWPKDTKCRRDTAHRPCLTINRLAQPIKQTTNQQRSNRPAIQVDPVDSGADPDKAEVIQGLIRRVELQSDADVAYWTAGTAQVRVGRGYVRVVTEYADDDSDEQEIFIRRIRNPFTVYMDPSFERMDGSDAKYAFIVEDIPIDEYKLRYKNTSLATLASFKSVGDTARYWMPTGSVRVAEYFYIEEDERRRLTLQLPAEAPGAEPQTVKWFYDELPPDTQAWIDQPEQRHLIVDERMVKRQRVLHAIINGNEIIEGNDDKTAGEELNGKYIPIGIALGDEFDIDGKVDYRGIVRDARDAQRMVNYWVSKITEAITLAPIAPWVAAEGQISGYEALYKAANVETITVLPYKPTSLEGHLVPPPQRNVSEPAIQAMVVALQQAENALRAVTGALDVQQREQRQETSGKAILARQKQSEVVNSNFLENLSLMIRHVGRIVLGMLPAVYDTLRVRRILGADEQPKMVAVHAGGLPIQNGQPLSSDQLMASMPPGVEGIYDLSVGRYDVTISVGPSYASKRQEASEAMLTLVSAQPSIFPIVGPYLLDNMDWPGARELGKQLRKLWPPALQQSDDGQMPPEMMQAQLQQLQGQLQQLQSSNSQLQWQLQTKQVETQAQAQLRLAEIASRERTALAQVQAQLAIKEAELKTESGLTLLELEQKRISELIKQAHEIRLASHEGQVDLARSVAQATLVPPPGSGGAAGRQATV